MITEKHKMMPHIFRVSKQWSVFLDRDGVINEHVEGDYVRNVTEFRYIPGSLEAVVKLSQVFNRVIVVTNQQGVAKQLMTHEDLDAIHEVLRNDVARLGGKIDAIYSATQMKGRDNGWRKPGMKMAYAAGRKFRDIDFRKSIMVGDSHSDILFGARLGMLSIFVRGHMEPPHFAHAVIDRLSDVFQLLELTE